MRIKNRLSPYPVLDNYGDDYINSSYTAEYEIQIQFSEIYGKLILSLKNIEIENLIKEKKAVYTVHVECPSTCYRKVFSSYEPEIEFRLNAADVSKVIEVRTFIVLTEDVNEFRSNCFHPDYQGQTFGLKAHQIIAIGTAKDYQIQKDDRDIDSLPSIIQIIKLKDKKKGTMSVNTDNDEHIVIGLSEEVFNLYVRLGKNIFKATAFSLILLPAFVVVLQRMCSNHDDESVTSMHWYQVVEKLLNNNGFQVDDLSIENDSLLSICQSVFANPIERSFIELDEYSERLG